MIRRKWRAARALPAGDWLLLARIWGLLLVTDLGLRCLPFQKVQAILAVPPRPAPSATDETIRRPARLVAIAARHHLYPMTCLRRSLVLQRLLAEHGIATQLQLGVRKAGAHLDAHAWLEVQGVPVAEVPRIAERFAPLAAPEKAR